MLDWFSLSLGVIAALVIIAVESVRFAPSTVSQSELERRSATGDSHAAQELQLRVLLPLFYGLQRIVVTVLVVALLATLITSHSLWLGIVLGLALLLLVGIAVSQGWLGGIVQGVLPKVEPLVWRLVKQSVPVLRLFAPPMASGSSTAFTSRDELRHMIKQDTAILSDSEKTRLLSGMDFGAKTIASAMVRRADIITVGANETVGPLLLDKLHKSGHAIYPVVTKDLDHMLGWAYMSDLVPMHPEVKKVKDAVRARVHYLPETAPLSTVLVASLTTSKHLFLAVDVNGKITGLITLADALEHLLGEPMQRDAYVATDPAQAL